MAAGTLPAGCRHALLPPAPRSCAGGLVGLHLDYVTGHKRRIQCLNRWSNVSRTRTYNPDRQLFLGPLLPLHASGMALEEEEAVTRGRG